MPWYLHNELIDEIDLSSLDVAVVADHTGVPAADQIVAPRTLILRCRSKQRRAHLHALRGAFGRLQPGSAVELVYVGSERRLVLDAVYTPQAGDLDPAADVITLRFVAADPRWRAGQQISVPLAVNASIPAANYLLERGTDGVWRARGSGPGGIVRCVGYGPDGFLYAGGDFGIKRWSGSAWVDLVVSGTVNAITWSPDGTLYVGGQITSAGGVAVVNLAQRSAAGVWAALGSGNPQSVSALAIVMTTKPVLYVGHANGLRRWQDNAWDSGWAPSFNSAVCALVPGMERDLFVGGAFTTPGARVVRLRANDTIVSLGAGSASPVRSLALFADGRLALGSDATVAIWNGQAWQGIGYTGGAVRSLTRHDGGLLVAAAGAWNLLEWTGALWPLSDHVVPNADLRAVAVAGDGRIAAGFSIAGSATVAARAAITNVGTAPAPIALVISGGGYLQRATNGSDALYLDFVTVAGETLTLDLGARSVTSSARAGSQLHAITAGSTFFDLAPGTSTLDLFLTATAGATAQLVYDPRFWSLDGADVV